MEGLPILFWRYDFLWSFPFMSTPMHQTKFAKKWVTWVLTQGLARQCDILIEWTRIPQKYWGWIHCSSNKVKNKRYHGFLLLKGTFPLIFCYELASNITYLPFRGHVFLESPFRRNTFKKEKIYVSFFQWVFWNPPTSWFIFHLLSWCAACKNIF